MTFSTDTPLTWNDDRVYMALKFFGGEVSVQSSATDVNSAAKEDEKAKTDGITGGQQLGKGPFTPAKVVAVEKCGHNNCGPRRMKPGPKPDDPPEQAVTHRIECEDLWEGSSQIVYLTLPDGTLTPPLAGKLFKAA